MLADLKKDLLKLKDPQKAKLLGRYFKTGSGGYGEGDRFLGVVVPLQRRLAKKYPDLTFPKLQNLLDSKFHECRLTALFILTAQYHKAGGRRRQQIVKFYLKNKRRINNWDLVDLSAPQILGDYLLTNDRKIIYRLAESKLLWDRRIAVLATFAFISHGQSGDSLRIAKRLLSDPHDLIHKAVGWMLREVGKRDLAVLEKFLESYATKMPRTMLRYAIEKFPEGKRRHYLDLKPFPRDPSTPGSRTSLRSG